MESTRGSQRDRGARGRLVVVAAVAAAAALAACKPKPPPAVPVPDPLSPEEARREVKALVDEAYRNLRRGHASGMLPILATDLFVAGPGIDQVGVERSAAIVVLDGALDAATSRDRRQRPPRVRTGKLVIGVSPDGRSGWATDQLDVGGRRVAVTMLAAEVDGLWLLTAVTVADAVSRREADKLMASGGLPALPPPAWPGGAGAGNRPGPDELVAALTAAAADPELRLDQIDDDAVVVGTGYREVKVGARGIRRMWKKKPPTWAVQPGALIAATPDDGLVWIYAHATRDGDHGGPRRLFAVYRRFDPAAEPDEGKAQREDKGKRKGKRERGDAEPAGPAGPPLPWRLVLLQESVVPAP